MLATNLGCWLLQHDATVPASDRSLILPINTTAVQLPTSRAVPFGRRRFISQPIPRARDWVENTLRITVGFMMLVEVSWFGVSVTAGD